MLDYSLPIATRTRKRYDIAYKELYEKKKKQEKQVSSCSAPIRFKKSESECVVLLDDRMEEEEDSEGLESDEIVAEGSEEVWKGWSDEGTSSKSRLDLAEDSVADLDDVGKGSVSVIDLVSDSDDEAVSISKQGDEIESARVDQNEMRSSDLDEDSDTATIDLDDEEYSTGDDYEQDDNASDRSEDEGLLSSHCGTEDAKRSKAEGEGIGTSQKRKRNIGEDGTDLEFDCSAQHTRSHSGILCFGGRDDQRDIVHENQSSNSRNKRPKPNSQRDNRRSGDNDEAYSFGLNKGHDESSDVTKTSEKSEKSSKLAKKKSTKVKRVDNAYDILANSIFEDGESPLAASTSFGNDAINATLPLKFSFGKPPSTLLEEKSDFEKELDRFFEEMDFALRSAKMGSTDYTQVKNNDLVPPAKEVSQHMLCSLGEHYLILDEEIGLLCKYCPHVHQEIKYIVPEFASRNPYEQSGNTFYEKDYWSIPDDLQCRESGSNFLSNAHVDGTVWDLMPGLKTTMYPHQREGFEFIWRHIAGDIHLEKLQKTSSADGGGGCIVSHAPGTGKTRLAIVFLQAYMKFNPQCRPLIIAPRTMLLTWEEEFKKWGFDVPFHNLNNQSLSGNESKAALDILEQGGSQKRARSVEGSRWMKLYSWNKERSILGISYRLFEKLSTAYNAGGKKAGLAMKMRDILLDFPGIVVFDEGHTPRNDKRHMWKASSNIKTHRRIILSGTPFQNKFGELYNTICLARPDWIRPTCRRRGRKSNAVRAQLRYLANGIAKGDGDKAREAKKIGAKISPIVHVYRGSILQETLPGLRNSVVVLHPSKLQEEISTRVQEKNYLPFFKDEHYETLISVHPSALLNLENEMRVSLDQVVLERLKEKRSTPECGMKAKFVIELIRLSDAMNEFWCSVSILTP